MKKSYVLLAATTILLSAAAQSRAATVEELQKQLNELNGQVQSLKEKKESGAKDEGTLKKIWDKTRFGGYGELNYSFQRENGNGKGGNTFDPKRIVLYVDSELAPWISFNSELEWEHGGVKDELTPDNELSGETTVEQAFLDFKLSKPFNVKAGVMLVPLGAYNLYHEPTNYNSTERPMLDQILIPTTWSEMGVGIHGALGSDADYQLMVLNGLDGSEFSAEKGIRGGRQNFNVDNNRNKAVAGRLELRPMTNLYTNASFYAGNSGKERTAYTTIASFDGKYNLGNLDLAGEYVFVYQDNPGALGGDGSIGHRMSGYWVEGAYHLMPEGLKKGKLAEADAVLFARYSEFDTQQGSIVDPAKASGRFDRNYTTVGLAFKPTPTVTIKADYQVYDDKRSSGETALDNDRFEIALGFVF